MGRWGRGGIARLVLLASALGAGSASAVEPDRGWGLDLALEAGASGQAEVEEPPDEGQVAAASPAAPRPGPPPICLQKEPRSEELVRAAIEAAGLQVMADESRERRVRVAGWLPRLTAKVGMDLGDRRQFAYEPGSPRVDELVLDDGWSWDVSLTWDPAAGAFQTDELQVARETVRRARERRELALEVIRLQHARRRLLQAGLPRPGEANAQELLELNDLLHAWTGRRFAGQLCQPEPRGSAREGR